jgi:hypothetical protein
LKPNQRDEFTQRVRQTLAARVGLICSNPECRAHTTGPQSDISKAVNVGVAAHICAASIGGPRFAQTMNEQERRSATNGIWLCQTCAKLIDSDVLSYPAKVLSAWKAKAEQEAKERIGKTSRSVGQSSQTRAIAALKRDHKLRDDLHQDMLKPIAERRNIPIGSNRYSKFAHSEVIIRGMHDTSYPDNDPTPGISSWFKLEVFDFYHGGLECILDLQHGMFDSSTRQWAINREDIELPKKSELSEIKIFITGKIP